MKDAEDEAFDDLARRQGAWGGGYRAKRAAAADKLQEQDWETLPPRVAPNEELTKLMTKLMTDSYDQGVKDALESIKEGLDALPKREWVGLTDEEIGDAYCSWDDTDGASFADFARAIERLLKEKNT